MLKLTVFYYCTTTTSTQTQTCQHYFLNVTVKGKPRLTLDNGRIANYMSGSGSDTLVFTLPQGEPGVVVSVDLNGGPSLPRKPMQQCAWRN
jgi:hypothetical protein